MLHQHRSQRAKARLLYISKTRPGAPVRSSSAHQKELRRIALNCGEAAGAVAALRNLGDRVTWHISRASFACRRKPAKIVTGVCDGAPPTTSTWGLGSVSLSRLFSFGLPRTREDRGRDGPTEPAGCAMGQYCCISATAPALLPADCRRMPLHPPSRECLVKCTYQKNANEYGGIHVQALNISCRSLAFLRGRADCLGRGFATPV